MKTKKSMLSRKIRSIRKEVHRHSARLLLFLAIAALALFAWPATAGADEPVLVKDIHPDKADSYPDNLINFNGTLFFSADDGVNGKELWKSDGTEVGTIRVKDVNQGPGSGTPSSLRASNGYFFFAAEHFAHGWELWKSNGTEAGTDLVKDIGLGATSSWPNPLTLVNQKLFFVALDSSGWEPWTSDGTAAGTAMLKDINSTALWQSSMPSIWECPTCWTVINNTLFFRANDGTHGAELWKSDGTTGGTVLVKDINPSGLNLGGSFPVELTNFKGTLFFRADTGIIKPGLWKSDGTPGGTVTVEDTPMTYWCTALTVVNDTLFFVAWRDSGGWQLCKSDGTTVEPVKDINPNANWEPCPLNYLTAVNGTLFFSADDGTHGAELWKSDGTTGATELVKDINEGPGGGDLSNLTNVNGTLFFKANDGTHGAELWKSDGTLEGTVRVKDINTGSGGSDPSNLTYINGTLFFSANDGTHGHELWKVNLFATISPIADQITERNTPIQVPFTVSGVDTNSDDLVITATSSNEAILPNGNIVLGGSGDNRTITLTPVADTRDSTVVTITVMHGEFSTQQSFSAEWKLLPPTVSSIDDQQSFKNKPIIVDFHVSDIEIDSDDLVITATSSNEAILPNGNIVLGGSGNNRTITLTPVTDQLGSTVVTITVSDGESFTERTFLAEWWDYVVVATDPSLGFTDIQSALDALAQDGFVIVKKGVYAGDKNKNIVLDGAKRVIIRSENGPESTIINLEYSGRAFTFQGGSRSALEGFKIINGSGNDYGGAILIDDSINSPVIKECVFANNYARQRGGAIHVKSSPMDVPMDVPMTVIENCTFLKNGSGYGGGAISLFPRSPFPSILAKNTTGGDDSTFTGPPDDMYKGLRDAETGALYSVTYDFEQPIPNMDGQDFNVYEVDHDVVEFAYIDVSVSKDGVTWESVKASEAAGIRVPGDEAHGNNDYFRSYAIPDTIDSIRYVRIEGTAGAGGDGFDLDAIGAIGETESFSRAKIAGCRFFDNLSQFGGAISVGYTEYSTTLITNCAFSHNKAGLEGGSIHILAGGSIEDYIGGPTIINSTFLKNISHRYGGAIKGPATITHCTFAKNEALERGGAVYAEQNTHVCNSILWGNTAEDGGNQIYLPTSSSLSIEYTDLEGGLTNIDREDDTVTMNSTGGMIDLDPEFALDEDLHLMPDSPCIDAGTNTPPGGLPPSGMDGNIRPLDGNEDGSSRADMGAYEFDPDESQVAISPGRLVFTAREDGMVPEGQTLFIRNRGVEVLKWDVNEDIPWLRVEVPATPSPDGTYAVKLYADQAGLKHAIHTGIVEIQDSTGTPVLGTVEVTLYITSDLHVPADESCETIQQAIYAAIDGDVVLVANGTYTRDDGDGIHRDKNLDFFGKSITVRSENGPEFTTIDCGGGGRAFRFHRGETAESIVQGFTIKNGNVTQNAETGYEDPTFGGGIHVSKTSSPTILDCVFSGNSAEGGGGIFNQGRSTYIGGCRFSSNKAINNSGGAIWVSPAGNFTTIENCTFSNNTGNWGGAIVLLCRYATINNSRFTGNEANYYDGRGGAIYLRNADSGEITISNCIFYKNFAQLYGGALHCVSGPPGVRVYNSVFSNNNVNGQGGAILVEDGYIDVSHCTLYANKSQVPGGVGGIWLNPQGHYVYDAKGNTTVTNSILWNNTLAQIGWDGNNPPEVVVVNFNDCEGGFSGTGNINEGPLFLDPEGPDHIPGTEDDDLRLDPSSPCIDRGKKIQGLFSDIRGSLRPVDITNMPRDAEGNPVTQHSAFDMGAYEFSEDYGGIEGDLTSKAFKDLKIGSSLVVTGFEYEIKWEDKDPFAYDTRIKNPGEYDVNLALVNDAGLRIDLGTHTVEVSQHGYTIPFTFGPEHIGTWRIRVELVSDPNQFVLSDEFSIEYKVATTYYLGQEITPPAGADVTQEPEVDEEDATYWSVESKRLFAIAPVTTVITWYEDEQREIPIPVVAYITYPDDPQIHIADSQPVDLLPEGTRFDSAEKKYVSNDATISGNQFVASKEGWTVLLYRDEQAAPPDEKEVFEVVRTVAWDHSPEYPIESSCVIGTEVTDLDHCSECGGGYVFFENARYDGYGEMKTYDRETRQRPIFAVNEDEPDIVEDDLVVVWYKRSSTSGVCWPSKPVRYRAVWPGDAKKIVIASRLGSGLLDPAIYGPMENMLIYNQPDRAQPGYNANEEHAAFLTPSDATYPAVFALRTDLNKPADNVTPYESGDRSRPYVLLKYQDPDTGAWAFEVFEVVAQSGKYMVQAGQVVADDGSDTRYYLDGTGTLLTGAFPEGSYYLNDQGLLIKYGETGQAWYNRVGGTVQPVSEAEVMTYYIDSTGALIDHGLLSDLSGPPPTPSYYLDVHGVIVESDVYYRFHYAGTAGQEISPPYPLNQPAFGPCSDSYTSTETSVLKDKDNKFFAKHGGLNGAPAEDGVIHYFYRLQPGFFYDLDDNGVPDEMAGACIPWLDGLDGMFEGETPVDITYAITWPDTVPTLYVGETLTDAKTQEGETVGLPNIKDQCIVNVLFDQPAVEGGTPDSPDYTLHSVNLIDPLKEYAVAYPLTDPQNELPASLKPKFSLGSQRFVFDALPYHLKTRLTYDPYSGDGGELKLRGIYRTGTGEPLLLLNTLTERDIVAIKTVLMADDNIIDGEEQDFLDLVDDQTPDTSDLREQGDARLAYPSKGYPSLQHAEMKALTAGDARGTGYVTLAFNDHEDCPAPTVLSVIRVGCPLYRGEIKVIESDNPFDERLTLRHNGDFGGKSDEKWFQWKYLPADFSGIPEGPEYRNWQDYSNIVPDALEQRPDGSYRGAVDITVAGTGQQLLADKWFSTRYYHADICAGDPADPEDPGCYSAWTRPQLYEGWIKRVMKKINLFDQKVKDFHASDVNTLASMISLAGMAFEGEVALSDDPEYLQNLGIIEVYETLLRRGKRLSIDAKLPIDEPDVNKAILFAANRLAGLYLLLGNEAYADATDPTIGFSTADGQYGTEAPSIFCFQNQVDSLLEEELALLRGRDDDGVRPFYNRLIWNFTLGDGEVAYKENYNITDQETDQDGDGVPDPPDGVVDEKDAMVLYPQGHGDAWGHYLTAIKYYYDLLRHPHYTWIPQTEAILVEQTPVEVDYRDERRFTVAAAAKARTGVEVVNLTYRQNYVEDPEGQWQGYKDLDPDRAWGVDGWSRRAGQGALFDWVVGNAILPLEDTAHEGIAKVDRTTVVELQEVASRYSEVQAEVDRADVGLNPLGLAKHAVPFDIDPGGIANGQTHFEQIYDRAVQAMNNAIAVFNHANQSTMLLRHQQDTLADFKRNIENTEADFNNRLIEVFGYPYPDDCGPGKTYPTDYAQTGPDLYHYMYVDPSELMGVEAPEVHQWVQQFKDIQPDASGALTESIKEVTFHVATDSRFGLIKPVEWQGRRKAPGEIQLARSDLLQARARFEKAVVEYDNLLFHIERQADLIEAHHNLNRKEINILNWQKNRNMDMDDNIMLSRGLLLGFRTLGYLASLKANAVAEGFPTVMGVIAGLSAGAITDPLAPARGAAKVVGAAISGAMSLAGDAESMVELHFQQAKDIVGLETNIKLTTERGEFAVQQELLQLENLIHTEATLRLEIYNLAESMQQAAGRYLAALARGDRLIRDRLRFRKQTAARIQDYRYKDMTFRIFRNDALQKYRAQFDMAARYVYLAAKAYDYETTLLDYDTMAGQAFLTDIVRQRTIGLIEGGLPLTGTGLADPMKRMWQNFQVLKPQLGFNNPQVETNRFSLRRELFRIKIDESSNDTWRQLLEAHRVDNLWDIPEFRRYCRPFAPEGIPQPGILIPFSTTVTSGLNFFEWPLGGNDSYYSATNFATKVRSVGVWFSNYNSIQLAQTPRVYLVPVGEDVLRTPSYYTKDIRTWQVVDQKLPVPFPIVETEMENSSGWIPTVDTIFDEMFQIRRHSDFRAYHDSGYVNESEMTFDSRLVGRSVWNTEWLLIIPGQSLLYDPDEGLDRFIHGPEVVGGYGERTGKGVSDVKLFFYTYAYSGN